MKTRQWYAVVQSVLAAAVGVQAHNKHKEDFNSSQVWPFIAGGVVFTLTFIAVLIAIVAWVV
ncbi:MAG: DUF2970 domain-containing protein [Methylococcales bacterium]|nr:DUF2970 domain-containing protein [Methylococcales bacterium]